MWKSSLHLDKYLYARTNPLVVKMLGIFGLLATILMAFGFWNFLKVNVWYLIIFGPINLIFLSNKLLRYTLQFFFTKFDIEKHEIFIDTFWKGNKEPSVDVFLPWAGEDLSMHEEVVKAVSMLDYSNFQVYMLDDVGSIEHKALCEKYNFHYLSRPNKGQFKKSGNLQYGYQNSNGEFVLILDADFIPYKDALKDLIPYLVRDPKIGILQTPQYFEQTNRVHNMSKIEFGGGNIVEEFYRIVMPCRDEFKAAMCVGTSAVYRRTAILELKGTPKVHASEDLATGLKITRYGYYVKYLPLIESMGKSPETFQGYFKQHMRWCSGNLIFAKYWPKAKLNLMARLIYITNPLHYISEALTVVSSFQLLALLYFHSNSLSLAHTLYFLPYVILSRLIVPMAKANKNKVGTKLAAISNSYTYFYTYIRMMVKGVPAWQPSGVKYSGLNNDFMNAFNLGTIISSIYILCFLFVLFSRIEILGNYNSYVVLLWSFYSVFWHATFLTFVAGYVKPFEWSNANSHAKKAFVFAKSNAMLFLFVMLTTVAAGNAFLALQNPSAPTTLAFADIEKNFASSNPLQSVAKTAVNPEKTPLKNPARSLTVFAAENEKVATPSITLNVESGDSLILLAKKAITLTMPDGKTYSEKQVEYAASLIALNMNNKKLIKPGEQVTFKKELIIESAHSAKDRIAD